MVYLPQSLPAGVHLHALESVVVARRASGHSGDNVEAEAYAILEKLGVAHLAMHYLRPAFRRPKTVDWPGPIADSPAGAAAAR
ncbi:Uncharacterised protein [Kluyvera cryocrescens]|uniref:Uncharacterized protein n=1 Tax=Kluyvera cryocrescens TaxID=580 RepID=A0A485CFS4_KLUCR|nr:Uncharacterised protein [Kluyvera cryocrescens]